MENKPEVSTVPMSDEEQKRLAGEELLRQQQKEKLIAEYLDFLSLDPCSPDTIFFEIDYGGSTTSGRTVLCLGTFALHARMIGNTNGKVYNSNLGINLHEEKNYDVSLMTLRHHISSLTLIINEATADELAAAVKENTQINMKTATLIIHYSQGNLEVRGMGLSMAKAMRKKIYEWILKTY